MNDTDRTQAVLEHHLAAFAQGIDAILSDYASDSMLILPERTLQGTSALRSFFDEFLRDTPAALWAAFTIRAQQVQGQFALLVWEAKPWVEIAVDTYWIHDGKIRAQTFVAHGGPSPLQQSTI